MKFGVLAAAAVVLSLAGAGSASAAGCDVSVLFQAIDGRFDQGSLKRVSKWAASNPDEVAAVNETELSNGSRMLCLIAPPRTAPETLFAVVRRQLPQKTSRLGFIGIYSRNGQSVRIPYESRRSSGFGNRTPPRDNGLPQRPPMGSRN